MIRSQNFYYRLKKQLALFPGIRAPASATFLADHYAERRANRSHARAALDAFIGCAFHVWVPYRARSVARKYGLGRSWAKEAARIAHRRFVDPNDIALFRVQSSEEMDGYLRRFEHADISKRINPHYWQADCAVENKLIFYTRAAENGLPCPPLVASIVDGRVTLHELPPTGELALKPAGGEGGEGFRLVTFEGEMTADALQHFLESEFARLKGTWLVQPKIKVHPSLKDLSLNALSTARISTMLNEAGEPEIVTTVFRFASDPNSEVDNIKAGGLMAPVDPDTGVLGEACRGRWVGDLAEHPVSGGAIRGRQLPFWEESKALAIRAHRDVFTEMTLVGWDVALTPDGPILIEGNGKPCMIVAQRAGRRGVGHQRFGELIAYHLKHSATGQRATTH